MRIDPDTCRDPDLLAAEVRRLRRIIDATHPYAYAALERLAELDADRPQPDRPEAIATAESDRPQPIANGDFPVQDNAPKPDTTPTQGSVLPEWTSRPYYVDPPEGWRWGFPRLYDPQADGDMTEWMVRCGYPERLARQGLPCTFTACTEDGGI